MEANGLSAEGVQYMKETEIRIEPLSLTFSVLKNDWTLRISKSQTQLKYIEQLKLITKEADFFVPLTVSERDDAYEFSFFVNRELKNWSGLKRLNRSEKLRALCNVTKLYVLLPTRLTFFIHPNNIVFDQNLMPKVIYRGIRGLVKPFELSEDELLKQCKCYIIALFSKEYSFDELYNGSLTNATATKFEREVNKKNTMDELIAFITDSFHKEQRLTEKNMQLVAKTRFQTYKQMTIWVTVLFVIVTSLLFYMTFVKVPSQDRLLDAHNNFLASDYGEVIHTLKDENMEKLPYQSKYILAYSYIKVEQLSEREKEVVMKNINLKSDKYYLLYWIYNGMGDFDQSVDIAKYMDDPQLIIYGLIKQIERIKNDPNITGSERDEELKKLQDELESYTEEYDLLEEEEEEEVSKEINEPKETEKPNDKEEKEESAEKETNKKAKEKNEDKKKSKSKK